MTPSLNPIYQRAGVPVATAPSADLVTSVLDETEKTVSRLQRTAGVAIRQLAVVAFAAVIAFGGASTVGTTYGAWSDFDTTGNSAGAGVWTIDVVIDVVNTINPDSGGLTQVKIFGSDTFDPATIDMGTVCFGSATDPAARSCNVVSVNKSGPGALTIMVHFTTNQTGILAGDTHAVLTGKTYDGMNVFGIDEIKTAPAAKSTPTATRSTAPTATLAEPVEMPTVEGPTIEPPEPLGEGTDAASPEVTTETTPPEPTDAPPAERTTPAPDPEPTTAEDPDGQPPAVEVPDLVGVTLSQAVRDLLVASGIDKADLPSAVGNVATVEDADDLLAVHCTGLHCGDVEFEERITADAQQGTVLAQSQTAGAAWKLGKVLTLTVAVGPVEPPAEEMPEPTPEEPTEAPGEDAIEERAS